MASSLQVVYVDPGQPGYHCVYYMARLAADLLGGEFITIDCQRPTRVEQLSALLPRSQGGSACLLICPSPAVLGSILRIENWRKRYGRIVAWVFDSFWTDHIPRFARMTRLFDHVFVTERDDLDSWRNLVPCPVDWLPWGSDVLGLGSSNALRKLDLLRFGRQPADWDDDLANELGCQSRGLSFQGRPPFFDDAMDNQRSLMKLLGDTRFTLSFTNRVSPSVQTHPTREYITGRWTDALAAGATVAGIPPLSESVEALLWPEAFLDLGTVDQAEGFEVIASAVRQWTPERAALNYIRSLEHLDWRWRYKRLAEALGLTSTRLNHDLARIGETILAQQPLITTK